jgi:hypothetical protein
MHLEYSDDAVCTFISTLLMYRGYSAQLRRYDHDNNFLAWSHDIVLDDIDHEDCSLLLHYYDYDDESGGPLHPLKTIDLWDPENEALVLYIY